MSNTSKRCAPVIVFLDIVIVLLFIYITLPHEQFRDEGFSLAPIFESSFINNVIISEYNEGNPMDPSSMWIVKDNNIQKQGKKPEVKFSGYKCLGRCKDILDSFRILKPEKKYAVYLPEKNMLLAYSLWDNFCNGQSTQIICNNNIRINASTGEIYLCDINNLKFVFSNKRNKLITLGDKCK